MSIARLFTQQVTVETFAGYGTKGPVFAAPQVVLCFVNHASKLITAPNGQQVVAESTIYAALAALDTFAPQSRVTVDGQPTQVINAHRRDSAGPASAHHVEVHLA